MTVAKLLKEAAEEFSKAQSARNPPRRHRQKIGKLALAAWEESRKKSKPGDGVYIKGTVTLPASHLYTLIHQAMQLLPE